MKTLTFTKMHGIGNDFVFADFIREGAARPPFPSDEIGAAARFLCDRKFGVGADGVVAVLPGSGNADFAMRMWNPDGSEAEMCGNAIRCVAKLVHDRHYTDKRTITVQTGGGVKTLDIETGADGTVSAVTVDMGEPRWTRADLAMEGTPTDPVIGDGITLPGEETVVITGVSMGNPHAVYFEEATDESINALGSVLEMHPVFPRRINVHVAEILGRNEIKMLTWERGAGRTLACGTGACAVAVAAHLNGLTERNVLIHLAGGDLRIDWTAAGRVRMTGAATEVFTGEIEIR